jgi:hypothetical protein
MSRYRKRAVPRNIQLDLFDWHLERELRRTNRAARRLAERFGISITHAAALAHVAGLPPEPFK